MTPLTRRLILTAGALAGLAMLSACDKAAPPASFKSLDITGAEYARKLALTDANGQRQIDNLLKPDLVAPGNAIVGAAATRASSTTPTWNTLGTLFYSQLVTPTGITQTYRETQMQLSGTSVAAPAVSGAVAVMLQANPGLTPPLVKAILQYTAQPIAGASLLQQGAGLLNLQGAMRLTKAMRTDTAAKVDAGTMTVGASILAEKNVPSETSSINGTTVNWSRIAFVGGNTVVSGDALFQKFQPIYDPRFVWANGVVRKRVPTYWSGTGITANPKCGHRERRGRPRPISSPRHAPLPPPRPDGR